jgi:N-carbamoylputrescine amidase
MSSSPRPPITVAAIQTALSRDTAANIKLIESWIRAAAAQGAQVILPSELFAGPYFCRQEDETFFAWAQPAAKHPLIQHFQAVAAELAVVLPISFFEKSGPAYYNSMAMIDADGTVMGIYRKSHIPDGPGYEEKFYFRPGDTGFKVWPTRYGKIGLGICWDQWFPECARAMTLMGAELLLYPTAIGSEPQDPTLNTKDPWQRVMIGHAVANVIPVIAANRIGDEEGQVFYGHSFIADHQGEKLAELDHSQTGIITAQFDLSEIEKVRAAYGFFRDRRPELYSVLLSADGNER